MSYTPYRKGTVLAPSGPNKHLHIICCDPLYSVELGCECVLVVNVSSVPNTGVYDPACILSAGVHNFIQHSSYLLYRLSVLWRVPTLSNKVDSGEYKIKSDVNEDVLSQVILGFKQSEQTPFKILRFIEKNNIS